MFSKTNWRRISVVSVFLFAVIAGMLSHSSAATAKALTKKEVKVLIASAKTSEDHMKLAQYFKTEADGLEAEAKDHDEMVEAYRKNPMTQMRAEKTPAAVGTIEHCEFLAKSYREAAKAAREMAGEHEQMAKNVGK